VVGTQDDRAAEVMKTLYRPIYINRSPLVVTDRRTAELIKYAANAFLATKITFINEIADLCEKVGADVQDVARGMGLDNRIGSKFLHAGPGFGGSCFPKDTLALLKIGDDHSTPLRIVDTVIRINDRRKTEMSKKVAAALDIVRERTIAVLGLTFKPNTDDMREAPSIPLIEDLISMGAVVRAYDPIGVEQAKKVMPDLIYCADEYDCAKGANALVIVTEWEQFRALDLERLKQVMATKPAIVDLRNIYPPDEVRRHGFIYESVGRSRPKGG
jgi:UDPglucose 6-dehydrogenase